MEMFTFIFKEIKSKPIATIFMPLNISFQKNIVLK